MRTLQQIRDTVTRRYLKIMLRKHRGNVRAISEEANVDRSNLYRTLERLIPDWPQSRPRHKVKWDHEPDPTLPAKRGNCTRYDERL